MVKPGPKSGAEERYPIEKDLLSLGVSVVEIASRLGVSDSTVWEDITDKGGLHVWIPSRPKSGAEIYGARFLRCANIERRAWSLEERQSCESIRSLVEESIGLNEIKTFLLGMFCAHLALQYPADHPGLEREMELARAVFDIRSIAKSAGIAQTNADYLLWDYFQEVVRGQRNPPTSKDNAIADLAEMFRLRASREKLQGPFQDGFAQAVREAIDALASNQASVLRMRYGIDSEVRTLRAIGALLGCVTNARIEQIEKEALVAIRDSRHGDRLREYLTDFSCLSTKLVEAQTEIVRLRNLIVDRESRSGALGFLATDVEDLGLPSRCRRRMRELEISKVGQLVRCARSDLRKQWFGKGSLDAIANALSAHGYGLDGVGLLPEEVELYPIPDAVLRYREALVERKKSRW
jgi:hypothetical protein